MQARERNKVLRGQPRCLLSTSPQHQPRMGEAIFNYQHRVTYADCTVGNHMYYGRYLELLEAARGEFFRALGATSLEWQERETLLPVTECRLRYRLPARYDDTLTIATWLTVAAGVRLNFAYHLHNQTGAPVLEGETFHACTTVAGKPKRLPLGLLSLVQPYLHP
jgi:acyl-CoA thioester hydrolase